MGATNRVMKRSDATAWRVAVGLLPPANDLYSGDLCMYQSRIWDGQALVPPPTPVLSWILTVLSALYPRGLDTVPRQGCQREDPKCSCLS